MQTVKIAARYTRYLLTSLATGPFGMNMNEQAVVATTGYFGRGIRFPVQTSSTSS